MPEIENILPHENILVKMVIKGEEETWYLK
jgi:hypothetical protein